MAVVGLGVSNLALVRFLVAQGAHVEVRDRQSAEALGAKYRTAEALGVAARFGADHLKGLERFDAVFLTPGMRKDLPEIQALQAAGVAISCEVAMVLRYCRAPIIGITGSAGKTTTTTLVGRMLQGVFPHTYVGGNIGQPLIEQVLEIQSDARVVMELSSFQLELLDAAPQVAAVLNLRPNHLDIHGSMEAYARAKRRIFERQREDGLCLFNAQDTRTWPWRADAPGRVVAFSGDERWSGPEPGVWCEEGCFVTDIPEEMALPGGAVPMHGRRARGLFAADAVRLPGRHNRANVAAATALALLAGAPDSALEPAVRGFGGVPHRLETVLERGGVRYVNDSIATAPDRAIAALDTFDGPLVLIAGGYDKGLPFEALAAKIVRRVPTLVLVGATAERIEAAVRQAAAAGDDTGASPGLPRILRAHSFEEAVRMAAAAAGPGDTVLLSPACASYDMFPNFEARGAAFRRLIENG